jgi:LysM repeat protein
MFMPPRPLLAIVLLGLLLPTPAWGQPSADSTYTVESGDTVYRIAQTTGASVEALMRWNDLDDPGELQIGDVLRVHPPTDTLPTETTEADSVAAIPTPPAPPSRDTSTAARRNPDSPTSAPYGTHTVEAGDTFIGLALRLGTTADTLFALNDRTTDTLTVGRTLRLPRRFGPPTHVVDSSETIYDLAEQYGVSTRALRTLNDLDTTALTPGQRLRLPERPNRFPPGTLADPDSTGPAAVYPDAYAGRLMASGRAYDPDDFVVSHPSLPFGSVVLLSRPDTDAHAFARVLDRGPVEDGLLLDLSTAVAQQLQLSASSSLALRVVWRADN